MTAPNSGAKKDYSKYLGPYLDAGNVILDAHHHEAVGHLVREGHGSVDEGSRLCVFT